MRKKFVKLGIACLAIGLVLFALSFVLFHYLTDTGFVSTWQPEAGKPFVTEMVADLGVLFLFSGCMSFLVGKIFFSKEK